MHYNGNTFYDYHFWYRAKNGDWYNKHGWTNASECVGEDIINPSTADNSSGWKCNLDKYNSDTVYYVVKSK